MKKKYDNLIYSLLLLGLITILTNSCKKDDESGKPLSVKDIDGNVYQTIKIGKQVWMAENLKVTRYRNGDLIGTTNPTTLNIADEVTPKYQWAFNGDEGNVNVYGRLYTWYAVSDSRSICPIGWHVPTDAEWQVLIDELGGLYVASGKLREAGFVHWLSPNTEATNSSGFTALPGGYRDPAGGSSLLGISGIWWMSNEYNDRNAWEVVLDYDLNMVEPWYYRKNYGYSVRCVKD